MPTRFYFSTTAYSTNSPAYGPGWEQTGEAARYQLIYKKNLAVGIAASNEQVTVPITTTQDILNFQCVSVPIPPQRIIGTFSVVIRCSENATTDNATLAVLVKVVSQDGTVTRGTLYTNFNAGTEFALTGAPATRIVNAAAVTATTTQPGDRLVVEIGVHATGPTTAGSAIERIIIDAAAADYALTTALTTALNPWCEFSQDIFSIVNNNYLIAKAPSGISVSRG